MKKVNFSSIIYGAVLAISFVLTKTLITKKIFKNKKPVKVLNNVGIAIKPAERVHKKVEPVAPSKGLEHSFFIDYPKNTIEGSTSLICNNIVMVDSVSFTKAFGMDSLYNREKNTLTILYNESTLIYNLTNRTAKFNNEPLKTEQYATIFNDLIFIPLPITAEIFGLNVQINYNDRVISIFA